MYPLFYEAHHVQYARLPVLKIISLIQTILSAQSHNITQCVLYPHPCGWLKKANLSGSLTGCHQTQKGSKFQLPKGTSFKAVAGRCEN